MKSTFAILLLTVGMLFLVQCNSASRPEQQTASTPHATHSQPQASANSDVPAHLVAGADLNNLGPTLPADKFTGQTRAAYQVVKEIPKTIAQLPCYCHCDRGFGHKSLHSCFEDEHAAHCAVCVNEALLAYHLEKDQKLSPEQIRERIIAEYSNQ